VANTLKLPRQGAVGFALRRPKISTSNFLAESLVLIHPPKTHRSDKIAWPPVGQGLLNNAKMRAETCPFCNFPEERIIATHGEAIAISDEFPVSQGHTLVVPRQHVASIFELSTIEYSQLWELVITVRQLLADKFQPAAFNIGVNDGKAAGQTIQHAHIHVIPRYDQDVDDPRGGIRWVLPDKVEYWQK